MEYLSQIPIAKTFQHLDEFKAEFLQVDEMHEKPLMHEPVQNQMECSSEIAFKLDDVESALDLAPSLESVSHHSEQQYSDLQFVLNQAGTSNTQYDEQSQYASIEQALQLPPPKPDIEEVSLHHYPLEAVIPENGDIVIPDPEQSSVMDKSDYVLEIYELLEDGSKTVQSENFAECEEGEGRDMNDLQDFDIEEGTESQLDFDDEQYIDDEILGLAGSGDEEAQPMRQRRANKRKLQIADKKREHKCTVCSEIFTNAKDFKYHK